MWVRIHSGFVFAAVAISLIAVMLLFVNLVNTLSSDANEQDRLRSRQAILAAIESEKEKVTTLVLDNSFWDDAVRNVYGVANTAWVEQTWTVTTIQSNADFMVLLDENDAIVAAIDSGEMVATEKTIIRSEDLDELLQGLPRDGFTFRARAQMVATASGRIAIAGAGPLLGRDETKGVPGGRARMLVFGKYLTDEMMNDISGKAVVQDIALTKNNAAMFDRSAVPVTSGNGTTLGWISWRDTRPGDIARNKIEAPATIALTGLVTACILLMFFAARTSQQLRESEKRERGAARLDALTGLPNRRSLADHLSGLLAASGNEIAVLMIDLDRFKDINDTYGHEAGDLLLRKVSARFAGIVGDDGFLARLGGDEFAVVFSGPDASVVAAERGRKLIAWLVSPVDIEGRMAGIGASIGLASGGKGFTAQELLRRADVAMYCAKSTGKNRLRTYAPGLDAERDRKLRLSSDLRLALQRNELSVAYQPIYDGGSGPPCGVEALARWTHRDEGVVSPQEFVGIAEEFGLIDQLGMQILEQSCRDAVGWGDIRLSVNVSPAQFRNPDFVDMVLEIVEKTGFDKTRLELEVTENYLIHHEENGRAIIERLQREGISVALDDFGTGYSSIGYLRQFGFDKLKLDRSLISGIAADPAAQKLLQATLLLARSLSLRVTVEGVEEETDANFLRTLGCDYMQGYFFGRPQMASQFNLLLPDTAAA